MLAMNRPKLSGGFQGNGKKNDNGNRTVVVTRRFKAAELLAAEDALEEIIGKKPPTKQTMRAPSSKKVEIKVSEVENTQPTTTGVVKNFRKAKGLTNIYRCARTDELADRLDAANLSPAEKLILCEAGLILDLRSPSEIKQEKVDKWANRAPGGKIRLIDGKGEDGLVTKDRRGMLNLDVLGPKDFSLYAERKWLTSAQEIIQLTYYKAVDGEKLHNMRVDALNKRGLFGLNEVILESGRQHLCRALKAITLHLEKKGEQVFRPVIIHCAQGKDRTGMLVMLLQSILGVSDKDIIDDYHQSEAMIDLNKTDKNPKPGRLDRAKMRRAPKLVMKQTLEYLRGKYGSVSPGYLQAIGFNDTWRIRLVTALLLDMDRPKQSGKSKKSCL